MDRRSLLFDMSHILLKEIVKPKSALRKIAAKCPVSAAAHLKGPNHRLYRGTGQPVYVKFDPTTRQRRARDTNNFSLLFCDGLESWRKKRIPRRGRSVIFTRSESNSEGYGNVRHVWLEKDPLVAYGKYPDNYQNYVAGLKRAGLHDYGIRMVDDIDSHMGILGMRWLPEFRRMHLTSAKSPEQVFKFIRELEESILGSYPTKQFPRERNVEKIFMGRHGILHTLSTVFDPDINDIKVVPLSEFLENTGGRELIAEAWSESPYYLTPLEGEAQ